MSEILSRAAAETFDRDPQAILLPLGGRTVVLDAGATLLRQGLPVDDVFCLLEGTVKVEASEYADRTLLLCFSKPPTFFGDVETFTNEGDASCTITAVTRVRVWRMDRHRLRSRLGDHPEVAGLMARGLAAKLASRAREAAMALLNPLTVRYQAFLNEMGAGGVPVPIRLEETASVLATSPRHLQRVIRDLVLRGIVVRKARFLILKKTGC